MCLKKAVTHIFELFSDFSWSSIEVIGCGLVLFDVQEKEGLAEVFVYHVLDWEIVDLNDSGSRPQILGWSYVLALSP